MKGIRFASALLTSCAVVFASCEKDSKVIAIDKKPKMTEYQLVVPSSDGRASIFFADNNVRTSLVNNRTLQVGGFSQFLVPDAAYRSATCLLDVSKLKSETIYNSMTDGKLCVQFVGGFLKKDPFPLGWAAAWNKLPFVEIESPHVLYSMQQDHMTIMLSKPCIIFGFELAPNLMSAFEFWAGFYDSKQNSPVASVSRTASTPGGAQLFAVKSNKPFDVIEIQFGGDGVNNPSPYGFAITAMRYKLAK